MGNKNTIVVGDSDGLETVDIRESKNAGDFGIGMVNSLQKLNTKDHQKQNVFAACTEDGLIRIFRDSGNDKTKGLEEIKKLNVGKKNQKGGYQVGATNVI